VSALKKERGEEGEERCMTNGPHKTGVNKIRADQIKSEDVPSLEQDKKL